MSYVTINPVNNQEVARYDCFDEARIEQILEETYTAQKRWFIDYTFAQRAEILRKIAQLLRERADEYGRIISLEMGKLLREARGEVNKCALVCEYYADQAESFLASEPIHINDQTKAFVMYQPLGVVLGVMPWNFPFWQVFRYVAPALMTGNGCLLKHASNVPQCALAIEQVIYDAGLPEPVFKNLLIRASQVNTVIASPFVQAVTLTGSEPAGRAVASAAGQHLKKSVLELGGSDPFIVLADADIEWAASQAVISRYLNCGQSCIAAKRFILVPEIADAFLACFAEKVKALTFGDPLAEQTSLAPMARVDLRDELHQQVQESIAQGAQAYLGCSLPSDIQGAYYPASILDNVLPSCRAWHEELFGPVAIVIRAQNENDAIRIANASRFGLGGSVWTRDLERGERFAHCVQSGSIFVNQFVQSDPRLPFGGIKDSGYGRELSLHGIREFVNAKTVSIKLD